MKTISLICLLLTGKLVDRKKLRILPEYITNAQKKLVNVTIMDCISTHT